MKILRVDDDVHEIITKMALADDRKITPWLNRHFREYNETGTSPRPKKYEPGDFYVPETAEKNIVEASPKVDANVLVDDLFNTPEPVADDHLAAGEFACCLNETRPCKHWAWDVATGDGYINSLSGRRMEVE